MLSSLLAPIGPNWPPNGQQKSGGGGGGRAGDRKGLDGRLYRRVDEYDGPRALGATGAVANKAATRSADKAATEVMDWTE